MYLFELVFLFFLDRYPRVELLGHVVALGGKDFLEKGMATHSSIRAWRSPWTEEPGGLQSTGSQGVGHD